MVETAVELERDAVEPEKKNVITKFTMQALGERCLKRLSLNFDEFQNRV